jgi:uncharacterized protein
MNQPQNHGSGRVISEELLKLLVCPIDRAELRLEQSELVCSSCGRRYPIEDGIPNMLVEV